MHTWAAHTDPAASAQGWDATSRAKKPLHWHIDYLTAALPIVDVVAAAGKARLECIWVKRLISLDGTSVPAPGFGSSDCQNGCRAHLVRLPDDLKSTQLEEILSVEYGLESTVSPHVLEDLVRALLVAIDAGDDAAAERVAQACAGKSALVSALHPLLIDADPDRRWWAVRVLAATGGAEAGNLLVSRLSDTDEATRCAAALGLGQLRTVAAIPALAVLLDDSHGWVRDTAADALAMIGEPALPALVEMLNDGPDGARVRAAGSLRRIVVGALTDYQTSEFEPQFWPAIGALFTALNDPNRLVRHNAYEALDQLGLLETVIIPA